MAASHKDEFFFAQESPGSTPTLLRGDRKRISYISDSSSGLSLDFSNTAATTVCDQSVQDVSSDQYSSSSSCDLSSVDPLTLDPPEGIHLCVVDSFELIDRYDKLNPVPNLTELYSTDSNAYIDRYTTTIHPSITSTCAKETYSDLSWGCRVPTTTPNIATPKQDNMSSTSRTTTFCEIENRKIDSEVKKPNSYEMSALRKLDFRSQYTSFNDLLTPAVCSQTCKLNDGSTCANDNPTSKAESHSMKLKDKARDNRASPAFSYESVVHDHIEAAVITSTSTEIPTKVQEQNLSRSYTEFPPFQDTSHSTKGSCPSNRINSCDDPHTCITVEEDEPGSGTKDFPSSTVNMPNSDQDTDGKKGRFTFTLVVGCRISREGLKSQQC